jgi:acyl-CoA synthetase (AMP-forming)/AMP-acid ligase II
MEANGIGELIVRGAHVTKGYYKLPNETAEVYQNGWVYTGDMAYKDAEGFIYLVGRIREMINRGGENVYPVEVENVLHLHPKVLDVAVLGIPDPVLGELVGCAVVHEATRETTEEEQREYGGDWKAVIGLDPETIWVWRIEPDVGLGEVGIVWRGSGPPMTLTAQNVLSIFRLVAERSR